MPTPAATLPSALLACESTRPTMMDTLVQTGPAPASQAPQRRWSYKVPTALGMTESTLEVAEDALRFTSDDVMGGSQTLPWASIREGCTAAMAGMGGRGAPDLPNWVPARIEWLVLSRTAGGGDAFMRVLPQGRDRDAIVAAMQARLGTGWIGDRLPVKEAQQRLGITEGTWSTLKVIGLVIAVLASLALLLVLLMLLMHPVILIPTSIVLGTWLCRRGLRGLSDGLAVANTPTAKARSAALGLVELEGRAIAAAPSPAAVTGRPSAWWDVTVSAWSEERGGNGEWRQIAARHGGRVDVVEFEDDTGRVPVWLPGATLLLDARTWESGKDVLPPAGVALLDELGFPWGGRQRLLVREECLEVGQTLYVLGTLDERRNLRDPSEAGVLERGLQQLVSGRWRRTVVGAAPASLRVIVSIVIGYVDLVTNIGRGGERAPRDVVAAPPALAPNALVVWKGRTGRPFLVSSHTEEAALAALRTRSLWTFGAGAAALCYTLYQVVDFLVGR
jgi:hypothetical protein